MAVPKRYAQHLTEDEWRRLALDSIAREYRGLVANVLNAITSVAPASEEDRRMAVESLIRYARDLAGAPDLGVFTEEETLRAINLANEALDGLRGGQDPVPRSPGEEGRTEGETG